MTAPHRSHTATALCRYCDRPLTNPESQANGAGPVCASRHGMARFGGEIQERGHKVRGGRGALRTTMRELAALVARKRPRRIVLVCYQEPYQAKNPASRLWVHGLVLDFRDRFEVIADAWASGFDGPASMALVEAMRLLAAPPMINFTVWDHERAGRLFTGAEDGAEAVIDAMPLEIEWVEQGEPARLDVAARKLYLRALVTPTMEQLHLPLEGP